MNTSLLKQNIHKPLALASRYISTRPALPVLSNVLIEATDQDLVLSATNLDTTVKINVQAEVNQTGSTTVSAKGLYELINTIPAGKIDLELQGEQLQVKSKDNQATFNIVSTEDFPVLPVFNQDNAIALPIPLLTEISEKILFAASTDESRPILTTVLIKQEENIITFVSTDGYRLSEVTKITTQKHEGFDQPLLLPAKILAELIRIGADDQADTLWIDITTQSNQIAMKVGQVEFFSKLINGNYPPYQKIIPTQFQTTIELSADELQQAVKVASIFSRDSGSQVKLEVDSEKSLIQVASQSASLGTNTSTVQITAQGEPISVGFNSKFLLDALSVFSNKHIKIEFKGPESPIVITSADHPEFKHIIMPLRGS